MKTLFKVTNRSTRLSQVLNSEELNQFFKYKGNGKYINYFKDYAIKVVPKKYYDTFTILCITTLVTSALLLLTLKIIKQWI